MIRSLLSVAVLAAALGGCVSVLPTPVIPSALIALPVERAMAPRTPLRADVNVFPPDATRAHSGVDIAVRADQELVYLADVRWADAAPRLLQTALVNALSKAGGEGRANPAQMGARADYDLRWRIVELASGKETAPVRAEVTASLVDAQTRQILAQQTFSAEGTPTSSSPRDRAVALAGVAQKVCDDVAAFVTQSAQAKAVLSSATVPPT